MLFCRYKDAIRKVTEREKEAQEELAALKAKFARSEDEWAKYLHTRDALENLVSTLKAKLHDEVDRRMRAEHEVKHHQVRVLSITICA